MKLQLLVGWVGGQACWGVALPVPQVAQLDFTPTRHNYLPSPQGHSISYIVRV
jgi:hypothetical protein